MHNDYFLTCFVSLLVGIKTFKMNNNNTTSSVGDIFSQLQ